MTTIEELLKKPVDQLSDDELQKIMDHKTKAKKQQFEKAKTDYENSKNEFVRDIAEAFKEQAEILKGIKKRAIGKAEELKVQLYKMNGKEPADQKSFQIKDDKDEFKLVVETQERFEFTEAAQVHIQSIKEIFKAKFEGRNKGLYNLLDKILMRNSKGDYDPKLLAKAKKEAKELGDDKLVEEFDKLQDCMIVVGSSTYCRVYEKDEQKKWKDISLNFSAI